MQMEVGDLVRYKNWWGGHIGRCIRVRKAWDGTLEYVFFWYTDGTEEHEELIQLEKITCSK
jgi:hypothetical protein